MRSGTILAERYVLGDRLGTTGDGDVWTGHDSIFDVPVTVKVLAAELAADEAIRERFRQVALRVSALARPGIVDVHDCFEEPDADGGMLVCLITQRVAGRSLRELLAESGAMPPARALDLVAGVARTLGAAHRDGVVHGDLKPENLIVADDESVTIVDFGFQTPAPSPYTAPELTATSPAADVYGLGAIVYECLTGRAPAADGDISPLLADLDPADAAPIMKAMSPQPNHRFASAAAFADACLRIEPALADGEESDPVATASTFAAELTAVEPQSADDDTDEPVDPAATTVTGETDEAEPADSRTEATPTGPGEPPETTDAAAVEPTVIEADDDAVAGPAGDGEPPRSPRNQAVVIVVLLMVVGLAAAILHFVVPDPKPGATPDREPSTEYSTSESASPTSPATDVNESPNRAEPAPTSSSPSPSDPPTPTDDDAVQVPFVIGMTVETARAELTNEGLLVIVHEEDEGRQQCRVHQQDPLAGESVPRGTPVTIYVRRVNNPQQCIDPT